MTPPDTSRGLLPGVELQPDPREDETPLWLHIACAIAIVLIVGGYFILTWRLK